MTTMMKLRSLVLVSLASIALASAAGCSHAPAKAPATAKTEAKPEPTMVTPTELLPNVLKDRRGDAGVRAAAKPLVLEGARSVKCGALTKSKADDAESDLLGGRLRVRAPAGAKIPTPAADAPPLEEESRVIIEPATAKEKTKLSLAIVARETFQLDPDMYEPEADAPTKPGTLDSEAPKFLKATFTANEGMDVAPVELGSSSPKMRAYAGRPREPNAPPGKDTALVLAMLIAQDDGALESVAFYVRGETVRNATGTDLVGCTRLAERIASSIVSGPRKLERAAGKRHIMDVSSDEELAVMVPADYVATKLNGGVGGARLTKLRPLSLYAGSISVAVSATSPEKKIPEGADATAAGKLLGHPMEWRGKTTPKGGFFFAAEPIDADKSKQAEVLVKATRQAKALDEMRGVAETLTVIKRK